MSVRSIRPVLAALAIGAAPLAGPQDGLRAQDWRTQATSRLIRGEEAIDVRVEYAAGRFALRPAEGPVLYRVDSRYDARHFVLRSDYDRSDGRGRLRIDLQGEGSVDLKQLASEGLGTGSLEMALSAALPVRLDVELGASEATLELGGLRIRALSLRTGASDSRVTFARPNPESAERCSFRAGAASFRIEQLGNSGCRRMSFEGGVGSLEIDFTGEWGHPARARIQMGLGSVNLRIPRGLPVRIDRSTFLMAFSAPGLRKQDGNRWVSEEWNDEEDGLVIELSGAFGSVSVSRH